jgi:hypothetical protein
MPNLTLAEIEAALKAVKRVEERGGVGTPGLAARNTTQG